MCSSSSLQPPLLLYRHYHRHNQHHHHRRSHPFLTSAISSFASHPDTPHCRRGCRGPEKRFRPDQEEEEPAPERDGVAPPAEFVHLIEDLLFEVLKHTDACTLAMEVAQRRAAQAAQRARNNRTQQSIDVGLTQMKRRLVDYRNSLYKEGNLDSLYLELQELQDVIRCLFSSVILRSCLMISPAISPENVDFKRVDAHVHKLKGSSSSIGASRAKNACIAFRDFRQEENIPECLQCLQQPKQEFLLVKRKLETLFEAAGETSCSCRWVDPEDATRRLMVIAGHVLRKKRKNQHIEAITILLRLSMCNVSQL